MIPDMESRGFVFSAASESANVATHAKSSQRNVRPENVNGATGLKSTAIETNPAAHRNLPVRKACATTARAATHTTSSSTSR